MKWIDEKDREVKEEIYKGEFVNGLKEGFGYMKWFTGNEYFGEFKNDKMNGKGFGRFKDFDAHSLTWKDGKLHDEVLMSSERGEMISRFFNGALTKADIL